MNSELMNEMSSDLFSSSAFWILNKKLVKSVGPTVALYLVHLVDWHKFMKNSGKLLKTDDWFYSTYEDTQEVTGINTYSQRLAIKVLLDLNVIKTELKGLPSKLWFKLNINADILQTIYKDGATAKDNVCEIEKLKRVNKIQVCEIENIDVRNRTQSNKINKEELESKDSLCKVPLHSEKKTLELRFIPSAEKLAKIICTKKNIKITPAKINNWSLHLHKLYHIDGVSIRDIDKALNYLSDHWMDKYCPHIESGQTFREKYLKLTNQMDKPNKPQIKQSEPTIESKPKTYNSTNDWYDCETINRFDD